jgi:F-type H+-transporting ATPase subunit b
MKSVRRFIFPPVLCFVLAVSVTSAHTQETAPAASSAQTQSQSQPEGPNAAIGSELAKESKEAEEHEENAQFKYSPTLRKIAKFFGWDPHVAYFGSLIVNFGILILFFWVLLRGKIPAMFRSRTDSIQAAIKEARAASAEATERLKGVEARLAKLDADVAGIRAEAEKQAGLEEEKIRAAAVDDKQRIVESAKLEIDAIARNARRDLKTYASGLAVDIASRRIKVDESADHALVSDFIGQLGKDGR